MIGQEWSATEGGGAKAHLSGQVLGRLGLAGAGGALRRAAEDQVRRLRGGDVDAVGERRDHEAARAAEVLERVAEERVADVQDRVVLLALVERLRVTWRGAHVE